jgi:uncharacterized protein (DUF342 family)
MKQNNYEDCDIIINCDLMCRSIINSNIKAKSVNAFEILTNKNITIEVPEDGHISSNTIVESGVIIKIGEKILEVKAPFQFVSFVVKDDKIKPIPYLHFMKNKGGL